MKSKSYLLSLLALILILTAAVQPALAYFTANSQADGAVPLALGSKTEITETVTGLEKTVQIQNKAGSAPVWIRAIAYVGAGFKLSVSGWGSTAGSGEWVYYNAPVPAGGSTAALKVTVTDIPESEEFEMTSFNVSVQYESIPVKYDENGDPIPATDADWSKPLDVVTITP